MRLRKEIADPACSVFDLTEHYEAAARVNDSVQVLLQYSCIITAANHVCKPHSRVCITQAEAIQVIFLVAKLNI